MIFMEISRVILRPKAAGFEESVLVKVIPLESNIAVAPQLGEADFAEVAALGFRSVVNNRPDGEAPDQLPNAQAKAAAQRSGLEFRHDPVTSLTVTDDDVVDTFARAMENLPKPILFYCRSGTRCATLWVQAAAHRIGIDQALAAARRGGYDLDFLRETLAERSDEISGAAAQPFSSAPQTAAAG
jgi:sulfide:quinone oxidoreductase